MPRAETMGREVELTTPLRGDRALEEGLHDDSPSPGASRSVHTALPSDVTGRQRLPLRGQESPWAPRKSSTRKTAGLLEEAAPHRGCHVDEDAPEDEGPRVCTVQTKRFDDGVENVPVIQFDSAAYYVSQRDSFATLTVWKLGNLEHRTEVGYCTSDSSAVAGENYFPTDGKLVFEPGEAVQKIKVKLRKKPGWRSTLEFFVLLQKPPSGCNALTLGRNLWKALVRIACEEAFPTQEFAAFLPFSTVEISPDRLMRGYFERQFNDRDIRGRSFKWLLVSTYAAFYKTMRTALQVYLIDYVITDRDTPMLIAGDRTVSLGFVLAMMIVPFALLHYLEYIRTDLGIAGRSRAKLQKALIRRYLNYSAASRNALGQADLDVAMRDADVLATSGYMSLIALIGAMVQLAFLLLYELLVPYVFQRPNTLGSTCHMPKVLIVIMPAILVAILIMRRHYVVEVMMRKQNAFLQLEDTANGIRDDCQLVRDFQQTNIAMEWYTPAIAAYNHASGQSQKMMMNSSKLTQWCSLLCVASYIALEGLYITQDWEGEKPLPGMFASHIAILNNLGAQWLLIHDQWMNIENALPAVTAISRFLNRPADIIERQQMQKATWKRMDKEFEKLRAAGHKGVPCNELPIIVQDVNLSQLARAETFFAPASDAPDICTGRRAVELAQGKLISIIGPRGGGKSILLRALAGTSARVTSKQGTLFMPSHLRVIQVHAVPIFFHGTLFDNLTWGSSLRSRAIQKSPSVASLDSALPHKDDAALVEVLSVCRKLRMPDHVLSWISSDECMSWDKVLSNSQAVLINIARALIAQFEVICMHKVLEHMNPEERRHILRVFKEYVSFRGLTVDPATTHLRRPRTIIFTSHALGAADFEASVVDEVFSIGPERGLVKERGGEAAGHEVGAAVKGSGPGVRPLPRL